MAQDPVNQGRFAHIGPSHNSQADHIFVPVAVRVGGQSGQNPNQFVKKIRKAVTVLGRQRIKGLQPQFIKFCEVNLLPGTVYFVDCIEDRFINIAQQVQHIIIKG